VGDGWYGQILFGGGGGESNGGLDVFGFQAGEVGENIFGGISAREAGQYGPKRYARAPKDRLSAANAGVTDDSLYVGFGIACRTAHGSSREFHLH
jgi:hypothetical protein